MTTANYFALFDLQPEFDLDLELLGDRYRALARELHPDRVANASDAERRGALERSAELNEAYQTLKVPPLRARHLLALLGHDMDLEATIQDPDFLMQQLVWREELEDLQQAADLKGIGVFKKRLAQSQRALEQEFSACWQSIDQRAEAERLVRRLQFLDKLSAQVRQLEERLDD